MFPLRALCRVRAGPQRHCGRVNWPRRRDLTGSTLCGATFRRRNLVVLAAAVIAIPAAVIMIVVFTAGGHGSDVRVPHLVGMTGVGAEVKLEQIGLKTYSDQSAMTPPPPPPSTGPIHGGSLRVTVVDPPPGFVIEQTPGPGTFVHRGSTVYISVAPTPSG